MMQDPHFASDLDALLEAGKVIPRLPDVVRARSLARARATATTPAPSPFATGPASRRRGLVLALAASVAAAIAGASALAALKLRSARSIDSVPPSAAPSPARARIATVDTPAPTGTPTVLPATTSTPKPQHSVRPAAAQESYAAELALLQRAQVAYAGGDFVDALALVAEHGRRFPSGRLAEEREALRVRSLAHAGRAEEAQRAAAAFAERFPRSVLLSRPSKDPR
jgi:hypothetical protein